MSWFSSSRDRDKEMMELLENVGRLSRENERLQRELGEIQELFRHQDTDLELLLGAAVGFRKGMADTELAKVLLDLCFRPMDLASFYVAVVDFREDQLHFVLYHEGGRIRNHPPRRLSTQPGLTGLAIQQDQPLYVRTMEEAEALGAVFTEAEKLSGLIPSSWYGVPFRDGPDRAGLISFQSFQRAAFSESRRKILDALVSLFSIAYSW